MQPTFVHFVFAYTMSSVVQLNYINMHFSIFNAIELKCRLHCNCLNTIQMPEHNILPIWSAVHYKRCTIKMGKNALHRACSTVYIVAVRIYLKLFVLDFSTGSVSIDPASQLASVQQYFRFSSMETVFSTI